MNSLNVSKMINSSQESSEESLEDKIRRKQKMLRI